MSLLIHARTLSLLVLTYTQHSQKICNLNFCCCEWCASTCHECSPCGSVPGTCEYYRNHVRPSLQREVADSRARYNSMVTTMTGKEVKDYVRNELRGFIKAAHAFKSNVHIEFTADCLQGNQRIRICKEAYAWLYNRKKTYINEIVHEIKDGVAVSLGPLNKKFKPSE